MEYYECQVHERADEVSRWVSEWKLCPRTKKKIESIVIKTCITKARDVHSNCRDLDNGNPIFPPMSSWIIVRGTKIHRVFYKLALLILKARDTKLYLGQHDFSPIFLKCNLPKCSWSRIQVRNEYLFSLLLFRMKNR